MRTTTQTPQKYSPSENISMGSPGEAPLHLQSQHLNPLPGKLPSPSQTLCSAIYLFNTGKLTRTLEVLLTATYDNLFKHFVHKLLANPAWAETEAGYNYFHYSQKMKISINYILQAKAGQFACLLYNDIHPETPIGVISPYR